MILLDELIEVLQRDKFARHLARVGGTPRGLALRFAALAQLVEPVILPSPISADADDDAVIACALAAGAEIVVSGDKHLLQLQRYQTIEIITAADMLKRLPT